MYEAIFLGVCKFQIVNLLPYKMTSKATKEIFLKKFLTNTHRKYFSWSLFLLKSEILDCNVKEKGTVLERFFLNFGDFRTSLSFSALPEKSLS